MLNFFKSQKKIEIHNADIVFRCDATVDQFIDVVEGKRSYIPCIYVRNNFFLSTFFIFLKIAIQ